MSDATPTVAELDRVMKRSAPIRPRPTQKSRPVPDLAVTETPAHAPVTPRIGDGDSGDGPPAQRSYPRDPPPAEPPATWRTFPVATLPDPIRGVIERSAEAIGCDPSMIALPMLSAMASLIGNARRVGIKGGWTEPAILWTATVMRSGGGKSPAFDVATVPISELQRDLIDGFRVVEAEHEAAMMQYEKDLAKWKRNKTDDPPPEAPAEARLITLATADATVEGLVALLEDNPRGVLLARDELSGWIGGFDRYACKGGAGGDAAHWLSMHGGRSLRVDRKTGKRVIYIPAASVSITGTIQPSILKRVLGTINLENGMGARLMLAMPPQRQRLWNDAEPDENDKRLMQELYAALVALQPTPDERNPDRWGKPRIVALSPEALQLFIDFFNAHNTEREAVQSEELAAAFAKLEGGAARLALILHCVRVAGGESGLDPALIDDASMAAGIELARWFVNEARRIYAMLSETDAGKEQRELIDWIAGRGGEASVRDLTHGRRRYRGRPKLAESDLDDLVDAGVGVWTHPAGPGRPSTKLVLNEAVTTVTDTETATHQPDTRGIGDGDTDDTPLPKPHADTPRRARV